MRNSVRTSSNFNKTSTTIRSFSTQKSKEPENLKQKNPMKLSGIREAMKEPLVRDLLRQTGMKEPKIVSHKY